MLNFKGSNLNYQKELNKSAPHLQMMLKSKVIKLLKAIFIHKVLSNGILYIYFNIIYQPKVSNKRAFDFLRT
jgi:hypothetical protein